MFIGSKSIILLLSVVSIWSCQEDVAKPNLSQSTELEDTLTGEQKDVVHSLRTYCKACHAVNPMKFIASNEDDQLVWDTLMANEAPSGQIWAREIISSLEWPDGRAPAFDSSRTETQDWMPKGEKRLELEAASTSDNEDRRQQILRVLSDSL